MNEEPDLQVSPIENNCRDRVIVTQQTEGDLTTNTFDKFLNEVYAPEQIKLKARLGNLENKLNVVETLKTEILKSKNLEEEIRVLKSNPHPKVVSDDKRFKDLQDKTEEQVQIFLTEAKNIK